MITGDVILGIIALINLLMAFVNAKEHDICHVMINCTTALICMMSICS